MGTDKIYSAGIVGCGRIGWTLGKDEKREQPACHTRALKENPRIRLEAACDIDIIALNSWHRENPGVSVYGHSNNMYEFHKLDIVVVAVNESNHLEEAVNAIIARPGIVILEKPVALNIDQALKIKSVAERNKVTVLVNHERRFAADYDLALRYLDKIGNLRSISATLSSGGWVYSPDEQETGEYSLIHDGTHLADAVLFFLENGTSSSYAREQYYRTGGLLGKALHIRGMDTVVVNSLLNRPVISGAIWEKSCLKQLSVHYKTSVCPEVTLNFHGKSEYFGFDLEIVGETGKICIGNGYLKCFRKAESKLYEDFYSLEEDASVSAPELTGYFSNMVQNAVDFLDGKKSVISTLDNGINALAIVDEIKNRIS